MNTIEDEIFTGKTVEEATEKGLEATGLTIEQAVIEVLDEGKKKLFGSVPARVRITKKKTDGERAAEFVDGLLEILKINGVSEIVSDDEKVEIDIQTTNSHAVIGRHGDVLDAIQCIAGAVANIGRDEYKKVVVDCEHYREQREQTLINLAQKLAKKAVERGRKVTLEPMNPYERRIIHSALSESTEVKTISEGREPNRFVVIVPNNLKTYGDRRGGYNRDRKPYGERREGYGDRKEGYGERREHDGDRRGSYNRDRKPYGERRDSYGDRRGSYNRDRKPYGERRDSYGDRRDRDGYNRGSNSGSRPPRAKKEIHFGTYLGNSKNVENAENTAENQPADTENKTEE